MTDRKIDLVEFQRLWAAHDGNLTHMAVAFYALADDATEHEREAARHRFKRFKKRIDDLTELEAIAEKGNIPEGATLTGGEVVDWEMGYVDKATGKSAVQPLHGARVRYELPKPEATVVNAAHADRGPTVIIYARAPRRPSNLRVGVALPDTQFGYQRYGYDGRLWAPMHDPAAIDVAQQIIADLRPRFLLHLGDLLDETEWSRWPQHPEFVGTTQRAVDDAHDYIATCEAAHPEPQDEDDRTVIIRGNHDKRGRDKLREASASLLSVRPAHSEGSTDDPPYSLGWLIRARELGVRLSAEYPGGEHWVTRGLVARHNPENKTAYDASVMFGHTHKMTAETFSRRGPDGIRHYTNYGMGCLCRVDDVEDPHALQRTPVASDRGFVKDWKQGVGVITIDESTGLFQVDQIHITKGRAVYGGRRYVSTKTLSPYEAPKAA